ncbi:PilZ domain-containing protein [Phreatobacter stygius]|uniref:PilZ domain-containing protein n=1 Tax=Phreatobacter stygius TaxID=1940610 RepID=A0A4D7ATB2_9HYPH|nr:PilZ domain-containing protein [Phreatobacter stygius]QCI62805.1 PilZ domain-containing protein [Phreatobacter stygius]
MPALAKVLSVASGEESRRFQRVRVDLLGRFMLSDRREFPCQAIDMSPGGAQIVAPVVGKLGERVVAYLDHIGRIEGMVVRVVPNGFSMTIEASARKRDKLADQLTWLANRQILGLPEDRRHERIVPTNPFTTITVPSGEKLPVRIIDISLSGAAIAGTDSVKVGDIVQVSRTMARVVRMLDKGFAVEFSGQQPIETILQLAREVGADLGADIRSDQDDRFPTR